MTAQFKIGQLATRTGRSIHTIRWYEAQGLIPGVTRNAGGARVYEEAHVGWLTLMIRLRMTGMPIAQMRTYAVHARRGRATLSERRALLKAHRERVEQTIAAWQEALDLLDRKIEFYGKWLHSGRRPALGPMLSSLKEKLTP